ncbi:GRAS family protein RAD1 [Linum perenne]
MSLVEMAFYPYPYLPIMDPYASEFLIPLPDDFRSHKRIKRNNSVPASIGSNIYDDNNGRSMMMVRSFSTGNMINTLRPRLHFRDHIWTYTKRFRAAEAIEEAAAKMIENVDEDHEGSTDGMRLVQLLIACAEAVACRDKSHASTLLTELQSKALVFGTSFQRVASCFVQGLSERLSLVQPLGAVGFVSPIIDSRVSEEKDEALSLVYENCPHIKFGHFVANSSIMEALERESLSLHVVDLGMTLGLAHGHQWRGLIKSLAANRGVARLRVTGVGMSVKRFNIIGDELKEYAKELLGMEMEFSVVESNLENLKPEEIETREGEVVVVNSILQLHCVVKESRGALNSVLQIIHKLSPKLMVIMEQDSSHNGPFFLGRFMEALHYYAAIFDAMDSMMPKYDTRRAKMEQFYFGEEIKNIVSCEGGARVERHEKLDQWRRRMSRAGFQAAPIKKLGEAKEWLLKKKVSEGYTVVEEKGCLVLGWKTRPMVSVSCWRS